MVLRPSPPTTGMTTRKQPHEQTPSGPPTATGLAQWFWRDRVLLAAFVICGLLIGFEVWLAIVHPAWSGPETDWYRAAMAWLELLVVVCVSWRLSRCDGPSIRSTARSWWMWSAALASYTIARNLWTIYDQLIYHHGVPFPSVPDLFFMLQYPFFVLAVILLPRTRFWGNRLILILDTLLIVGAAAAVSWNLVLEPLYQKSGISLPARSVNMGYELGDLFVFLGLTITFLRPSRFRADRLVVIILIIAVVCLMIADAWAALLMLQPNYVYTTGDPPDLFWSTFYLLVPLASIVQLRISQREPRLGSTAAMSESTPLHIQWRDFTTSLRLFMPIVAALLASAVILIHATMATAVIARSELIEPFAISVSLLLVAIVRQEVICLENAQLRREVETARANELTMREVSRHKDEFLGIVGHELKTPLASLLGYIQLIARYLQSWRPEAEGPEVLASSIAKARRATEYSQESVHRMTSLVDDLLDDARIQEGRLALRLEPCDLCTVVESAVQEQRVLAPTRTIHQELDCSHPVPVIADATRIGQVVTNFLTNALKYSVEDRPVEARLEVTDSLARVAVSDEGIGVPPVEQAYIWERFHRVEGNKIQTGSGVSLGIGLYICKSIIEKHHGQVGIFSFPGRGSTFWFTLPLATPAA